MLLNPFRPAVLGLHAGAVLATHVMAGALLGALTVAALAGAAGSVMAKKGMR
ncbi:hypothetical protein [Roseomonas indoligenes]|uniref:Uncharacterized protein n=1 Tax=Roseomonas indoligenes TaxID=2820811 RepID=A0A940MZ76_9PROT|nr:hypothetical protein [Pararoseomonas indoligenes]MBP0494333.1 hypothetical protein [Pararoseomonas indoligenes]